MEIYRQSLNKSVLVLLQICQLFYKQINIIPQPLRLTTSNMGFLQHFRELVEDDLKKSMGKPVINKNLWSCMLLDFLLIQFIFGPCNCFVWIGLWELLDLYIDAHISQSVLLICWSCCFCSCLPLLPKFLQLLQGRLSHLQGLLHIRDEDLYGTHISFHGSHLERMVWTSSHL